MDYFVRCHTFVNEICAVLTLQQITAVNVRHLSPWTLAMYEQLFIWKSGPFVSSLHISSLLRLSTILLQLLFRLWGNGEGSMGRRAALEYSLKEKGTALQRKHGTEWRQSDAGTDSQGEGKSMSSLLGQPSASPHNVPRSMKQWQPSLKETTSALQLAAAGLASFACHVLLCLSSNIK